MTLHLDVDMLAKVIRCNKHMVCVIHAWYYEVLVSDGFANEPSSKLMILAKKYHAKPDPPTVKKKTLGKLMFLCCFLLDLIL